MSKLTETELKRIIDTDERFQLRADGGGLCIGFREEFSSPVWMFRFKQFGEKHKLSLGHYPDVSLDEARELAASYRKLIESDECVVAAIGNKRLNHSEKELARTFSAMLREASRYGAKKMTVTIEFEAGGERSWGN